ncbi:DNA polymerase III subunit delta [Mariniluteicoccus endophyticus]
MSPKRSPFGRVVLVSGPESLLADRSVDELVAAAKKEDPTVEINDVEAVRLDGGTLGSMTGGSLFTARTVAVIRDLANLPSELHDQVAALAKDPLDDLALILVHGGGQKGKGLLDKVKKAKAEVVDCSPLKPRDLPGFVTADVRRHRGRISPEATQLLIDSVGHDLRSLAGAVSQLVADSEGEEIRPELVRRYFGGRAEVTSFAVTDQALAGNTVKALEHLRWALETGVAPVLITSAMANGLRGLGKLATNRSGMGDNDLARDIGVPPWKIRGMRQQLRGWDQSGLAAALQVVATADADIKGAADNAEFALERCVLTVSRLRRG